MSVETDHSVGTRTVTPHTVQPGEEVTVRIELDGASGKPLLTEAVSEGDAIREVSPDPVDTIRVDDVIYVSWDLTEPTDVAVEYTTSVAASAVDGAVIPFEGSVALGDETRPIGGRTGIEVVTDFFERLRRQETVTHHDVEVASQYADRGEITHQAFEHVYHAWQNGSTFEASETPEPATATATTAQNQFEPTETPPNPQQMSRQGTPTTGQQRTGGREEPAGNQRRMSGPGAETGPVPREEPHTTRGTETSEFSRSMNATLSAIPEAVVMYIVYGVFSVVGFFVTAVLVDATADFVNIPAGGAVAFVAAALVTAAGVIATVVATNGHDRA